MLAVPSMHDKTVAVLGLGRSGLSVCRALAQSGARTWAWDDAYERRASAAAAGTPIVDLATKLKDESAAQVYRYFWDVALGADWKLRSQ
jgi:UDP-N-acetylmuramoylalanine--D-glutamate ligase